MEWCSFQAILKLENYVNHVIKSGWMKGIFMYRAGFKFILPVFALYSIVTSAHAWDKGIYLTQYMLEKPEKLNHLLEESKAVGINTFIIDHDYYSSRYAPAMAKVKAAGIKTVARIVVFSDGGNYQKIHSQQYWEKSI